MKRLDRTTRRSALAVVVVLLALFVVAAWVARNEAFDALDQGAHALVRYDPARPWMASMRLLGRVASGYVLLAVAVAWSVALWRRRHRALALALPLVGVAAVIALGLMKWIIATPRPTTRGYGFPSGHVFGVTVAVMIAAYLLWRFQVGRRWQWALRAGGIVFIVLVGYSRLYVNAHWFSDVVGGLLVGLAFAVAAMLVMDGQPRPPA